MAYCVVIHEVDYLSYQVSLYEIDNRKKEIDYQLIEEIKGVNQDKACSYLVSLINNYNLSDYTQVINYIYKNYKESKNLINTLYKNIGGLKGFKDCKKRKKFIL